ncbi:hypothetical protein GOQ04_24250 [Emticicia sp. ODNR4P]|nr:hypothetical protein [Emticicia sp. ODNR4P]
MKLVLKPFKYLTLRSKASNYVNVDIAQNPEYALLSAQEGVTQKYVGDTLVLELIESVNYVKLQMPILLGINVASGEAIQININNTFKVDSLWIKSQISSTTLELSGIETTNLDLYSSQSLIVNLDHIKADRLAINGGRNSELRMKDIKVQPNQLMLSDSIAVQVLGKDAMKILNK